MNTFLIKKITSITLSVAVVGASLLCTASSSAAPSTSQTEVVSSTDLAYITNKVDKTVSVVDTATQKVIDTIFVGKHVDYIAVTPNGEEIYVGDGKGTISVINAQSKKVTDTVQIGNFSYAIAVAPNGKEVYAAGYGTVSIIDTETHQITCTISVGDYNYAVAISPDGNEAYVSSIDHVSVIDTKTHTLVRTIRLGDDSYDIPHALTITLDGKYVYVPNRGKIFIIDTATKELVQPISIEKNFTTFGMVFTSDKEKAYVIKSHAKNDHGPYEVSIINMKTRQVIQNIPVAGGPFGIAITSNGKQVYITNLLEDIITVIDTQTDTVSRTIPVGHEPYKIVIAPYPQ